MEWKNAIAAAREAFKESTNQLMKEKLKPQDMAQSARKVAEKVEKMRR